jgi:SAM-dependent methyltransferase
MEEVSYSGAQARYYDEYFTGLEGESEFYTALSGEVGAPVLELGCGTARTMLPIAASGLRIVGLDASAQMLALAKRKIDSVSTDLGSSAKFRRQLIGNIALVCADMRRFQLRAQFRLAILPYRTFQHLLTNDDRHKALRCIHDHLSSDGVLAFNVFDPGSDIGNDGSGELQRDTVFADPGTGTQVEVWFRRTYDRDAHYLRQELVYRSLGGTIDDATSEERRLLVLRYADPLEIEELLESSGFEIQALCGDFLGNPFEGSGEQVWIARKV